jgi:hypothetical protein
MYPHIALKVPSTAAYLSSCTFCSRPQCLSATPVSMKVMDAAVGTQQQRLHGFLELLCRDQPGCNKILRREHNLEDESPRRRIDRKRQMERCGRAKDIDRDRREDRNKELGGDASTPTAAPFGLFRMHDLIVEKVDSRC